MRKNVDLPCQSSSRSARVTIPRASAFESGATASSRSKKRRSVAEDRAFSIIFSVEAGTDSTERETLIFPPTGSQFPQVRRGRKRPPDRRQSRVARASWSVLFPYPVSPQVLDEREYRRVVLAA